MHRRRIGTGLRLAGLALDVILAGIGLLAATAVVAGVGAVRLALESRELLGATLSPTNLLDGTFAREIEARSLRLGNEMERAVASRFTPEQQERMEEVLSGEMERAFVPVRGSPRASLAAIRGLMHADEGTVRAAVDRAFAAVRDARIEGVSAADLEATRREMIAIGDELGLGTLLPAVVRYSLAVAATPFLAVAAYFLVEALAGASVGKLLLRLRVGTPAGRPAPMVTTLLRYVVKLSGPLVAVVAVLAGLPELFVASALLTLLVVGGGAAALGPERRALHDLVAGTAVYRTRDLEKE
jgi:uncharacterized RDD family membrane protein YckC